MATQTKKIAVISLQNDIHALAVYNLAKQQGYSVSIFCSDKLVSCISSICLNKENSKIHLYDINGECHDINDFCVIWWRRVSKTQSYLDESHDKSIHEVVNQSSYIHVFGLIKNYFKGHIINKPDAAILAENKITQIKVAISVGFNVPNTLFTNDPAELEKFYTYNKKNIIMKSYYNLAAMPIKTIHVTSRMLEDKEGIKMSPAIYQELIDGNQHYRIIMIGDKYIAYETINNDLDSRLDLRKPIKVTNITQDLYEKLLEFLNILGLEMGIFDFKRSKNGELFFLEINQQGQFAYLDALTGSKSLELITKHLINYAN
ncbi:hypothetical protein ACNPQK_22590 [Acinetobacter guillouiae]|uniref:hypothetical protein n=1 Tax=Acinetobacter TaxID=469 RepID=UPI003AF67CFD